MLMADMQRVVNSQQEVLTKLKPVTSEELDTRQVGNATFQVQHQVEDMLKSFESKIIQKFDELKGSSEDTKRMTRHSLLLLVAAFSTTVMDSIEEYPETMFLSKITIQNVWQR